MLEIKKEKKSTEILPAESFNEHDRLPPKTLSFEKFRDGIEQIYQKFSAKGFNKIFKDVAVYIKTTTDQPKKLAYLFENIGKKKFGINICWPETDSPHRSTALHALIANENFDQVKHFIKLAQDNGILIDFAVKDSEGKTIALMAIKIAMLGLDIIRPMLTKNTIVNPDKKGVTPLMLACALGQADIVHYIINHAKELISKGELPITFQEFIDMQDADGRTAAHYCLLREGTRDEVAEHTLNGILQSVSIDKDRDCKAIRNSFMLKPSGAFLKEFLSNPAGIKLTSSFDQSKEIKNGAVMFCQSNKFAVERLLKSPGVEFTSIDPQYLRDQMALLTNKTLAEQVMENRQAVFRQLLAAGINLKIKNKAGQTAREMVDSFKEQSNLTDLDNKYLLSASQGLAESKDAAKSASTATSVSVVTLLDKLPVFIPEAHPDWLYVKATNTAQIRLKKDSPTAVETIKMRLEKLGINVIVKLGNDILGPMLVFTAKTTAPASPDAFFAGTPVRVATVKSDALATTDAIPTAAPGMQTSDLITLGKK